MYTQELEEKMSTITVRTRGTRATVTAACTDGHLHTFRIDLDGTVTGLAHDPDEDSVIAALGGQPSACGLALRLLAIARDLHAARRGDADMPGLRFHSRSQSWRTASDVTCRGCEGGARWQRTIAHASSLEHQMATAGIPATWLRAGATFARWIERHDTGFAATQLDVTRTGSRHERTQVKAAMLSVPFMANLERVFGLTTVTAGRTARNHYGLGTTWLATLSEHLTDATCAKIRARGGRRDRRSAITSQMLTSISKARNVPAHIVARFLNAGVYAHLHTYIRAGVRPEQVLAVYRDTEGRTTLADLLGQGMSAADAIAWAHDQRSSTPAA